MAGLSKLIVPGDPLTASDVASNFEALRTAISDVKDENIEPGSIQTRHFVEQSGASDGLDFKSIYRSEFNETSIGTSFAEMVKLSVAKSFPRLYGEDSFVFVFAELEVYNREAVATAPIGAGSDDRYELRLEFAQATGAPSSYSSGAFVNDTLRVSTPGSANADVPPEIANVVLFGIAPVSSTSTHFDARVMVRSRDYSGSAGTTNGRCRGAISALVVSR